MQNISRPRAPPAQHIEEFRIKPSEENFAVRKCDTTAGQRPGQGFMVGVCLSVFSLGPVSEGMGPLMNYLPGAPHRCVCSFLSTSGDSQYHENMRQGKGSPYQPKAPGPSSVGCKGHRSRGYLQRDLQAGVKVTLPQRTTAAFLSPLGPSTSEIIFLSV